MCLFCNLQQRGTTYTISSITRKCCRSLSVFLFARLSCFNESTKAWLTTGGPSSSCEMIILRNNSHGGIIRVCMGIFTTALRNKKNTSNSQKKYLTLLPQSPFERVVHFEVFNVHKKSFSYVRWKPRNAIALFFSLKQFLGLSFLSCAQISKISDHPRLRIKVPCYR